MKTITFYSYKGGVGKSLALANIAKRLCEFNKKVCLIDFDLEAPGLPYKFPDSFHSDTIKKGLVDYIFEFTSTGVLPGGISDFIFPLDMGKNKSPLFLLPAGNVGSPEYWKKLSSINWYELLYENSNGMGFFLDMKDKIRKEIQPDFLLIDSRAGISEMSGISISLFADEVVIVAVNNKENLEGARKIIQSITKEENLLIDLPPKITLVLSRIPFTNSPIDRSKEQIFIEKMNKEFSEVYTDEIIVVHSDRELEEFERLKIGNEKEEGEISIANDYLKLFERVTQNDLTEGDKKRFAAIKEANRLYSLALKKDNPKETIDLLSQAINLNKENIHFFISRSVAYIEIKNYNKAMEDLKYVLSIDKNNIAAIEGIM
ncbi:MAG TPA: AAA family ATPase [Puia sp.]|nr:AAA family ATPase [Puia sp.]